MNFVVKCIHLSLKGLVVLAFAHALFILTLRKMVVTNSKPESRCGIPQQDINVERTLAIFKPDVLQKGVENEIEDIILNNGFTILDKKRILMTPEQTSDFYSEHYGKLFFASLVAYMSSGPSIVLVLAKANAVQVWRDLIGPTNTIKARVTHPDCLRAIYGCDETRNGFHGSDSQFSADREICFFFNNSIVEPIPSGINARDYLSKCINPTLLMGLTSLCKRKPINPVLWLADWLSANNPNKPDIMATIEMPAESCGKEKQEKGEKKYSYDPEKMSGQEFGLTAEERLTMVREQRQKKDEEDRARSDSKLKESGLQAEPSAVTPAPSPSTPATNDKMPSASSAPTPAAIPADNEQPQPAEQTASPPPPATSGEPDTSAPVDPSEEDARAEDTPPEPTPATAEEGAEDVTNSAPEVKQDTEPVAAEAGEEVTEATIEATTADEVQAQPEVAAEPEVVLEPETAAPPADETAAETEAYEKVDEQVIEPVDEPLQNRPTS